MTRFFVCSATKMSDLPCAGRGWDGDRDGWRRSVVMSCQLSSRGPADLSGPPGASPATADIGAARPPLERRKTDRPAALPCPDGRRRPGGAGAATETGRPVQDRLHGVTAARCAEASR